MTATNQLLRAERLPRRLARLFSWIVPAALLALAPKCMLCLLAYAGLGAVLRFGGPELCGTTNGFTGPGLLWLSALVWTTGAAGFLLHARRRRA